MVFFLFSNLTLTYSNILSIIIRYCHGIAVNAHGCLSKTLSTRNESACNISTFYPIDKKIHPYFHLRTLFWWYLYGKTQLLHTSRTIFHPPDNRHPDHSPAQHLPFPPGNRPTPPTLWESLTAEYTFIKIKAVPLHGEKTNDIINHKSQIIK